MLSLFCPVCVLAYQRTPRGSLFFPLEIIDLSSIVELWRSYKTVHRVFSFSHSMSSKGLANDPFFVLGTDSKKNW